MGFSAVHYHVGGKTFDQPQSASVYSREEFETLLPFPPPV